MRTYIKGILAAVLVLATGACGSAPTETVPDAKGTNTENTAVETTAAEVTSSQIDFANGVAEITYNGAEYNSERDVYTVKYTVKNLCNTEIKEGMDGSLLALGDSHDSKMNYRLKELPNDRETVHNFYTEDGVRVYAVVYNEHFEQDGDELVFRAEKCAETNLTDGIVEVQAGDAFAEQEGISAVLQEVTSRVNGDRTVLDVKYTLTNNGEKTVYDSNDFALAPGESMNTSASEWVESLGSTADGRSYLPVTRKLYDENHVVTMLLCGNLFVSEEQIEAAEQAASEKKGYTYSNVVILENSEVRVELKELQESETSDTAVIEIKNLSGHTLKDTTHDTEIAPNSSVTINVTLNGDNSDAESFVVYFNFIDTDEYEESGKEEYGNPNIQMEGPNFYIDTERYPGEWTIMTARHVAGGNYRITKGEHPTVTEEE